MSRSTIPPSVQLDVLTSCRRRCCLCFGLNSDLDTKKGQIAHLDHNPSNNIPDNLAYLCLDHHNEYDSRPRQTKSILDIEVKKYRSDLHHYWETPQRILPADIRNDVLQEMSLIPHSWKNEYMALYPGNFAEGTFERNREYIDVWDMFSDVVEHNYTEAEWKKYQPLFNLEIPMIVDKLEKLTLIWGEYLDEHIKHLVLKLCSRLETQKRAYPTVIYFSNKGENVDKFFTQQFISTLLLLGEFANEIGNMRKNIT